MMDYASVWLQCDASDLSPLSDGNDNRWYKLPGLESKELLLKNQKLFYQVQSVLSQEQT